MQMLCICQDAGIAYQTDHADNPSHIRVCWYKQLQLVLTIY